MASSWSGSWASAWANSWGTVGAVVAAPTQQGGGTSKRKRKRPKTYAEVAHAKIAELSLDIPQIKQIEEQDEDEILLVALTKSLH